MMTRWLWFWACAILGLVMVVCGLFMPVHLRAVDTKLLQRAGRNTPSLADQGLALASQQKLGPAQFLSEVAQREALPGREKLGLAVGNLVTQNPGLTVWGQPERALETIFGTSPKQSKPSAEPFTDFIVRQENRDKVLEVLRASTRPAVHELLRCRDLTNTVIFPPSQSSSGQAFDTAVSVCGLLLGGDQLSKPLSESISALASEANRSGASQGLEQVLLDLMSLGQRFNWGQLSAFVSHVQDTGTLRLLANLVRRADGHVPVIFSAVQVSGEPAAVANYLTSFSQTGVKDLASSFQFGTGAVKELLQRNQRISTSPFGHYVGVDLSFESPRFALIWKWFLYLSGGFLLAMAMHFARPKVSALEQPLQVRGFHIAREVLFSLGFLLVVLLVSEPFLSQDSQKTDFAPFHLRLPTVGGAGHAAINNVRPSIMNQLSLLTLLLFFVLQALIYTACLFKLAEIRRQNVSSRIKLKLLDNEDHLFDAGLYLGFVGTIISLILVSLGVIKPSLMAAYSSTSFGIIFVSIFKIFHLRPVRRTLLLESEAISDEPLRASAVRTAPSAS